MNGKWAANGDLGWWGAVHDKKDDWGETFLKLFDEIPADYWLAVLDCHT